MGKRITAGKKLVVAVMTVPNRDLPSGGGLARGPTVPGPPTGLHAHPLPSGAFPFPVQFDVLRRFMATSRNGAEPVAPAAVEGPGLPAGAAESNAAFLGDIGLLVEEMPGKFKPTPVAMQLINTQLADESRGRRLLRSIVEKTWFGKAAKSLLESPAASVTQEAELASALAVAAAVPEGEEVPALHLLVEYLVYTGIFVPPASTERPAGPPTTAESSTRPVPPARRGSRPVAAHANPPTPTPCPDDADREWEVIETSEFSLRVRPSASAIRRLRKQLDLLDERMAEARSDSRP